MSNIASFPAASKKITNGYRRYLAGVATMNNPECMQSVHAQVVNEEYKERIAKWGYGSMLAGSLAVIKATLLGCDEPNCNLQQKYLISYTQFYQWSNKPPSIKLKSDIENEVFGTAVKIMQPTGFMDPDTYEKLSTTGSAALADLMDGVGVHPFFDGWEPDPVLLELGPGSDDGGVSAVINLAEETVNQRKV